MDEIKKLIMKELISNDERAFIYNDKLVSHGDSERIKTFFTHLANEIQTVLHINVEATEVKDNWNKMRRKFVSINLKKSKRDSLSANEQDFYKYLLFLEPHISHKNHDVYETKDRKEIINKVYDELMGNVEVIVPSPGRFSLERSYQLKDDSLPSIDTQNLEYLDEYKDIVLKTCISTDKIVNNDNSAIVKSAHETKNVKTKKYPDASHNKYRVKEPLPSTVDDVKKGEAYFASLRTKNERFALGQRSRILRNIVNILQSALNESNSDLLKKIRLTIIIDAIDDFIKNL